MGGSEVFSPVDGAADMGVSWGDGYLSLNGRGLDAVTADRLILTLIKARREAFGQKPPTAAIVEILEVADRQIDETGTSTLILPNDVRINGVSVYTEGGVRIHEMHMPPKELPTVTLTLPVRLLVIGAESDHAVPADTR
jgi:hypothetical protein